MKTATVLFAAALTFSSALSSAPAHAAILDLPTMTCKQFLDGGDDTIKMVLTWMDGAAAGAPGPGCAGATGARPTRMGRRVPT